MAADFSQADLPEAVLETLVVSEGMTVRPEEAIRFTGATTEGAVFDGAALTGVSGLPER